MTTNHTLAERGERGEVTEAHIAKFWECVGKGEGDACWTWSGRTTSNGYPLVSKHRGSHLSLMLDGRSNPGGFHALHSCDNPPCCNPAHLRWGTPKENVDDMIRRRRHHQNRKTHCNRGHELSGDNLITRSDRQRGCKKCRSEADRKFKARQKIPDEAYIEQIRIAARNAALEDAAKSADEVAAWNADTQNAEARWAAEAIAEHLRQLSTQSHTNEGD